MERMSAITDFLKSKKYEPVSAEQFYGDLFPQRLLQKEGAERDGKYSAMVKRIGKPNIYLHDRLEGLDEIKTDDKAYVSNASYAGNCLDKSLARELYALAVRFIVPREATGIDIDNAFREQDHTRLVTQPDGSSFTIKIHTNSIAPTYVMTAGKDVFLFYLFDYPIPLFENNKKSLKSIATYLSKTVHNNLSDSAKTPVQKPAPPDILSRYPVVGTKVGKELCCAYKTGRKWSVYDLNSFVPKNKRLCYKPKGLAPKPTWVCRLEIYYGFINRVRDNAESVLPGCLEALASYARKCSVDKDRYGEDRDGLASLLESRYSYNTIEDHLEKADDLYFYHAEKIKTWTVGYIEKLSGLLIPRNKRNGRTQKAHLDILHRAASKEHEVKAWRKNHPEGKQTDCAEELGISRKTVAKWWNNDKPRPKKTVPKVCPCGCSNLKKETSRWYWKEKGNFYTKTITFCSECGEVLHETKPRIDN